MLEKSHCELLDSRVVQDAGSLEYAYSVLMSVYAKENPEYLKTAIQCMLNQTIFPTEFVIVKDGPLTAGLTQVIDNFVSAYQGLFKIVSYPENRGLGYALKQGVLACSYPLIARMDSDDVAMPDRIEKELRFLRLNDLDMVGCQVTEFIESPTRPVALTDLPESADGIVGFSKRRCAFRHPAMLFKKDRILAVGNYSDQFPYFEDWDIYNRLLANGCKAANIHEPLVAMRVSEDFYARRGGLSYLGHAYRFKRSQVESGWFSWIDFVLSFTPQAVVCILPNKIRSFVYLRLLRKSPPVEKEDE